MLMIKICQAFCVMNQKLSMSFRSKSCGKNYLPIGRLITILI